MCIYPKNLLDLVSIVLKTDLRTCSYLGLSVKSLWGAPGIEEAFVVNTTFAFPLERMISACSE